MTTPTGQMLFEAVYEGDLELLEQLLLPSNVNYVSEEQGVSLLMAAVTRGRLDVVRMLLGWKASLFLLDKDGFNVVHRAAWHGGVAATELLLFFTPPRAHHNHHHPGQEAGADEDVGASSPPGRNTHHSSMRFSVPVAERTLPPVPASEKQAPPPRPPPAFRPGAQHLVNLPHTYTGRTPLMFACMRNHGPLVRYLLDVAGADPSLQDHDGNTAMRLAVMLGHGEVVEELLRVAPGDGGGMGYPDMQRMAEEFGEGASTIPHQAKLMQLNKRLCHDLQPQSLVRAS